MIDDKNCDIASSAFPTSPSPEPPLNSFEKSISSGVSHGDLAATMPTVDCTVTSNIYNPAPLEWISTHFAETGKLPIHSSSIPYSSTAISDTFGTMNCTVISQYFLEKETKLVTQISPSRHDPPNFHPSY